jgi:hypothetical protein
LEEYLCFTVLSKLHESQASFSARLSQFWTHMLRNFQAQFEMVYAEKCAFESKGDQLARLYLTEEPVADLLEKEMSRHGIDHEPLNRDDLYSKYEAVAPEWMQIEH